MLDIELTATLPAEMVAAQQTLIAWMDKKIEVCEREAAELQEAYEHAKKQAWKFTVIKRHADLARKRVGYYVKIKAALQEGYCIVPNFPIELFAIRTNKNKPLKMLGTSNWGRHTQSAMDLPADQGEYKNPLPIIFQTEQERLRNDKVENITNYWAESWDSVEFPITMAKPQIMEITSRAMALKLFDQIGIMPGVQKNQDPVIIGQIIRKIGADTKMVSFMIAWHLNTNVL